MPRHSRPRLDHRHPEDAEWRLPAAAAHARVGFGARHAAPKGSDRSRRRHALRCVEADAEIRDLLGRAA